MSAEQLLHHAYVAQTREGLAALGLGIDLREGDQRLDHAAHSLALGTVVRMVS